MYYCEPCRVRNDWPQGYGDEPEEADEYISCQVCATTNVPCWYNSGWRLPVKVVPPEPVTWRNYNVVALCETMRKKQQFELLPILADALEDAGCTDSEVLAPLRGKSPEPWQAQKLVALIYGDESAAAVRWLERFLTWINYSDEERHDYEYVVAQGYEAVKNGEMFFGSDDGADYFRESDDNVAEFFRNWSLATGEPLPGEEKRAQMSFSCAC